MSGPATLGGSGVPVTALGFGAAPLGNLFTSVTDEEARGAVDAAWDAGIRYFDTAPHYGLGLAERRLGAALATRPRGEFTLQTKVGRLLVPVDGPVSARDVEAQFDVEAGYERRWDFSGAGVRRSVEESLERLGLDRIDVALVHDPDDHVEQARTGALPELLRMRAEGLVRAVGVGMNQAAVPTAFVEEFDLDVVLLAGRYNLLEQEALDDLLPAAVRRGTSVVVAGVYGSGLLAREWPADGSTYEYAPASAELLARAREIATTARRHGTTLPAVAVQMVLAHPGVASAVLGLRSSAEAGAAAALVREPVPAAVWDDLRGAGLLRADTPLPTA